MFNSIKVFVTTKPGLSSFTEDMNGAVESIAVLMKASYLLL